jgi:hypothetical protein
MDTFALEHLLLVKRFGRDALVRKDPEEVRMVLTELL